MSSSKVSASVLGVAAAAAAAALILYVFPLQQKETKKIEEKPQKKVIKVKKEGPTTRKFDSKDLVSVALCAYVDDQAKAAIHERGIFHIAVAGGSVLDLLEKLVEYKEQLDWSKVVLSFANHKCVKPNDEKATLAKSKKKFADALGITTVIAPASDPKAGSDGSAEAEFYAKALRDANVPHNADGLPVVDLVLLGLGADGHVGSCHPMGPAVASTKKSVVGSPKSGEPSSITFSIETMNSAREVAVVVCGGSNGKKEAVKRALQRPAEEPRGTFPAQLLKNPVFFLDTEAAANL